MQITDPLIRQQEYQQYKDNWLYSTISKMIIHINLNNSQLKNNTLTEFSIKLTDSNFILKQYAKYIISTMFFSVNSTNIYIKLKSILIGNSLWIIAYQIIEVVMQLGNLLMLDMFTDAVREGDKIYILYLLLILLFSLIKTYITSIQTQQVCAFLGKLDVVLNYELYKKLLSSHEKIEGVPNINTLITNDIEQIKQLQFTIKEGTTAIGMLIGCLFFLYHKDTHAGNVIVIVIICAQIFNVAVTFIMMTAQGKFFERKDARISLTGDILHGIKQIKYLSWEQIFSDKIMQTRKLEFQMLCIVKFFDGLLVLFWNNINYILLYFYIQNSNNLLDLNVFTLIAIFNSMIYPLGILPFCINFGLSALVSIKRVGKFMDQIDVTEIPTQITESDIMIEIQDTKHKLDQFTLNIGNFKVKKHTLNFIIGPIGSGKTTLFNSILNELQTQDLRVNGSISYCGQTTWIQNMTIRDNICFGLEYNDQLFKQVIDLCQLQEDVNKFENKDQYMVGPDGNNLSGGQKQRIALARAVYQNNDIYLFDDSFSSLDIPVGDAIFQNLILEFLREKTVLFITSNQHYISKIPTRARVFYLDQGNLSEQDGNVEAVMRELSKKSDDITETTVNQVKQMENQDSELEEREKGEVDIKVWLYYFSSMAWPLIIAYLVFNFSLQGILSFIDFWLKNQQFDDSFSSTFTQLLLLSLLITLFRAFFYVCVSLKSSWTIFEKLNESIMKAKMVFFDKTNAGRIINRLSGDMETIDGLLPWSFDIFLEALARGSGFVIGLIILFPFISIGLVGIFYAYYYIANTYIKTNRELKRLKQVNHAELLGWINETQKGIKTIRAFKKKDHFFNVYLEKLHVWNTCEQSSQRAKFWYFVRLNLTCNLLLLLSSVLILISGKDYQGQALALTYSILIIDNFNDLFNFYLQTEQMIISVERVRQYLTIPQENIHQKITGRKTIIFHDSCDIIEKRLSETVPIIELNNINLTYDGLNFQLKNFSLKIYKNEKVAIVGRTGSGKTSIMNILFQLYQHQSGDLLINGEDVKYLSLSELRSQLSIVPQFGFLFQGSIYENLDPQFNNKIKIDQCLSQFNQLKTDLQIEQGGHNLSNGEKQLINYLRIILQDKQIVCLDEATSNIDPETDKFLHEYLFQFVENRTLIVITHRLDYIHHYDKVIYLDKGMISKVQQKND